MNERFFEQQLAGRTIYVVEGAFFTGPVLDLLRPLPAQVTALSGEALVRAVQSARPDVIIVGADLVEPVTQLAAGQMGVLCMLKDEDDAAVWSLLDRRSSVDFVIAPFTTSALRLRLCKLLQTGKRPVSPGKVAHPELLNAIDEVILVLDQDKRIVEANEKACHLYGWDLADLLELHLGDLHAGDDASVQEDVLRCIERTKTNGPQHLEWTSVQRDGTTIVMHVRMTHATIEGGDHYVLMGQDITEQKRLIKQLQEIRSHYEALVGHVSEGVVILQDALVKADNHGLSTMLGYTVAEVEGGHFIDYVSPPFRQAVIDLYDRFMSGIEVPYVNEVTLVHREGHLVNVEITGAHTEYGGRAAVLVVVRNINTQKRAEQALLQFEEKFIKAFYASPDAMVIATWPEGVVLEVNHEFEKITGYLGAEVLNRLEFNFYAPNERHHILNTLRENGQRRDIPFVSQRKNGEVYPAALSFDFLEIDGQACTIEIVRDVTDQKEAENALRRSEEKFSKAFFASPNAITISTLDEGVIIEANRGFKNVFGYEPEAVVGHSVFELSLYANSEDRDTAVWLLKQDGFVRDMKLTGRHQSGQQLVTNVSMELIEVAGMDCVVTITNDITEQESALRALRASEEKFANIFQFSPNALSITDLQTGKFTEVNEGFELISGYSREEVIGLSIAEIGLYSDDRQRVEARKLFNEHGRLDDYEFVARQKSGATRLCTLSARIVTIGGGPCALVLVRDTTKERLAQEKIQQSETLLRETQALARLGSWSLDMVTQQFLWSDVLYDLFGVSLGQPLTYDDYAERVFPEDLPMVEAATRVAFKMHKDKFSFEHRIITAEGGERHLWVQTYLDRNENGRVIRVHGTAQDISERKLTEEALYESEAMGRLFQDRLRALHELTIQLSEKTSIDEFFYSAIQLGQRELGFERLEVFLFDDTQEKIYGTYGADETGRVQDQQAFHALTIHHPAIVELLQGNVRAQEWDNANHRYQGQIVGQGWVALAILWDGDKGIGFVSADNHLTGVMPPPFAKDLLALYGNALGHLLTRKRAGLEIENYVKQLQLLQQIDRAILRADSPAAMARSVLNPLDEILDCQFIDIARYDEEKNIIYSLANTLDRPLDSDLFGSLSLEVVELLRNGDPLELADMIGLASTAEVIEFWRQQGVETLTIIPLVDVELLGVLYVGRGRPGRLSQERMKILKQVSTQLAIALRHNLLHRRVENYANQLEYLVEMRTNQLAAKAHELEAFTYSVSHDLRAPLRAMSGFSQTLVRQYGEMLPEKGQHYLRRIQHNAEKMGRLIDDLLKLSRLGRQEMQFKVLDSGRLVQGVIDELEANNQLEDAQITVLELAPFYGDDTLLKQVWFNLITNAIKYTQKGQRPEIEIGTLQQKDQIVYYIQDQGIGFDMAYVSKLFGVFQRLHSAADYEGTGIGLATVQRIIHRHGGQIWAEAEVNNGATFYFTLEEQPE